MTLGSIIVRLSMQTADFETDSARAAKIAAKRAKEIDAAFRKAGIAIGLALGAGVAVAGAAFRKYIQNTIEAEKVQAQLLSRISDTGAIAGRSLEQLNAQAEKLQGRTIFDDEAIGGAQAMLLTFKDIRGLQFDKAVESALDLSTAMGTDLSSAALQLGKALNDPVAGLSALSRSGVQFSDDQKAAIKAMVEMGDKAGAQTLILRELDSQMGTAAEAARSTLGGALQGLSNDFDNLLEGDTGSAGLRGTVDAVNDLGRVLQDPDLKSGIDALAAGLLRITSASIEAVAWIGNAGMAAADYFGDTSKQSLNVLNNRRNDLETKLFKAERRSGQGLTDANDPLAKLFGLPSGKDGQVASLKAEIAAIDARLADLRAADALPMKFSPEYERASLMFNPNPKPKPGGSTQPNGRSGKSDVQRQAEEAARAAKEAADAQARWHGTILDMEATLAGPMAEAQREYERNVAQLNADYAEGHVTLADYARGLDAYAASRDKELEAIKARKTPAEEMLADMEFERQLIGKTREEQELLNAARWLGADAITATGQAAIEAMRANQEYAKAMGDQIAVMDAFRAGASDALTDFVAGAKSAKEALGDFFDDMAAMITRMIAERWMEQLFGPSGTSGGGGAGNLLGSLLGGLFGGKGFAVGGYTGSGGVHQPAGIVHRGEVVWSQGDIARAGGVAAVEAMRRGGSRPASTVNQTFVVQGTPDRMTRQQMARAAAAETSRAIRRG